MLGEFEKIWKRKSWLNIIFKQPLLPSLLVFPRVLQVQEAPIGHIFISINVLWYKETSGHRNPFLKILTLFPGGPEGPDSPVGPGEPWLKMKIYQFNGYISQESLTKLSKNGHSQADQTLHHLPCHQVDHLNPELREKSINSCKLFHIHH